MRGFLAHAAAGALTVTVLGGIAVLPARLLPAASSAQRPLSLPVDATPTPSFVQAAPYALPAPTAHARPHRAAASQPAVLRLASPATVPHAPAPTVVPQRPAQPALAAAGACAAACAAVFARAAACAAVFARAAARRRAGAACRRAGPACAITTRPGTGALAADGRKTGGAAARAAGRAAGRKDEEAAHRSAADTRPRRRARPRTGLPAGAAASGRARPGRRAACGTAVDDRSSGRSGRVIRRTGGAPADAAGDRSIPARQRQRQRERERERGRKWKRERERRRRARQRQRARQVARRPSDSGRMARCRASASRADWVRSASR
jgi:hypothetical protein